MNELTLRRLPMDAKTKALLARAPEIVAAVLCDKTMECCGKAKQCPYHSTDYNHISVGYGCDVDRLDADTAGLLKAYAAQLAAVMAERDAIKSDLNDLCETVRKAYTGTEACPHCAYSETCELEDGCPGWKRDDCFKPRGPQGAGEVDHAD